MGAPKAVATPAAAPQATKSGSLEFVCEMSEWGCENE